MHRSVNCNSYWSQKVIIYSISVLLGSYNLSKVLHNSPVKLTYCSHHINCSSPSHNHESTDPSNTYDAIAFPYFQDLDSLKSELIVYCYFFNNENSESDVFACCSYHVLNASLGNGVVVLCYFYDPADSRSNSFLSDYFYNRYADKNDNQRKVVVINN